MSKMKKSCVFLSVFVIVFMIFQYHQNTSINNNNNSRSENDGIHWDLKHKDLNVLYWTPMFRQSDFNLGLGKKIFEKCSFTNCYATNDRNFKPVEDFDAILFHGIEYIEDHFGKPEKRKPHQMYIISIQESPINTPNFIKKYSNFFNWTMTYRLDSDIFRPYGTVKKVVTDYEPPTLGEIQKRPKKIAWMVSNCQTWSNRERMYQKLAEHLPIDVYGTCGNLMCSKSDPNHCYQMIENNYKFYLSFENSFCVDYVTEKLYNILDKNIIPIVYGGANYFNISPPHSVINVGDFDSFDELIDHIKFLDSNTEEYLKYLHWKKDYIIDTSSESTLCDLCAKLNQPIQTKVYPNVYEWWMGKNDDQCLIVH